MERTKKEHAERPNDRMEVGKETDQSKSERLKELSHQQPSVKVSTDNEKINFLEDDGGY